MVSDSIAYASIPAASANPKDFAKKKRANRSAKLKQCKLDARREQWLSQVKNKGSKRDTGCGGDCHSPEMQHVGRGRGRPIEKLEIKPRSGEENEGSAHHFSDSDSASNSPTSHTSSVLGGNDSGSNFRGSSSSSSRSSSSVGCYSGIVSEEDDEGDDGCLDNWEAVADALAALDDKQEKNHHAPDMPTDNHSHVVQSDFESEPRVQLASRVEILKPNLENGGLVQRPPPNCRAWRPDDVFRPQSLPNLSKQYSFPMNSDRHYGVGGSLWVNNDFSDPIHCPICCEDFDFTDSSFFPCTCGYRLCLFCYKTISEDTGRCPQCRQQYKLSRSCSMNART